MSKSALTVLREARELISDPKRWTQESFAKTERGRPIGPDLENAVCWCAQGAVLRQTEDETISHKASIQLERAAYVLAKEASLRTNGFSPIIFVNDQLGHGAVLRMFDAAIASAEKEAEQ